MPRVPPKILRNNEWQSNDGSVRLLLGDCREILPTLRGIDAVVTDPPYGIAQPRAMQSRAGKRSSRSFAPSCQYLVSNYAWDDRPPDKKVVEAMLSVSRYQILFGGNFFEGLPPSRCWLVWDKCTGANNYADCELAWTNLDKPVRKIS